MTMGRKRGSCVCMSLRPACVGPRDSDGYSCALRAFSSRWAAARASRQATAHSPSPVAARGNEQPLHVEEQVFAGAIEPHVAHVVERHGVERLAQAVGIVARYDARVGQHHQMRVVDRHERRQEERLRILEVVGEDVVHVLGGELHGGSIATDSGLQAPDSVRTLQPCGGRRPNFEPVRPGGRSQEPGARCQAYPLLRPVTSE